MGNYNCTTGSRSTAYSRLPTAHYSYDHDHDDREPLLRNFTQRVDEQQQQLLHQIDHQVNSTVKETTTSVNMSRHQPNISYSNSNPPASKPPLQPILKEPKPYIHPALEKELQELRLRVAKLEFSCPSCSKQGEAMEKIKKKNATLEKKFSELTILIEAMRKRTSSRAAARSRSLTPHEMRSPIPDLIDLQNPVPSPNYDNPAIIKNDSVMDELSSMIPAAPQSHDEINNEVLINDLTGCLVVLIFFVAVLIGVLL